MNTVSFKALFSCLISSLPGPPGFFIEDSYFHLFPVNRAACPHVDPFRDITFDLFTKNNPSTPQQILINDDVSLQDSNFNFADPTTLFFHGFLESSSTADSVSIKDAYMKRNDNYNFVIVNAKRLVAGPWYIESSLNVAVIGKYTAQFIEYLVSRGLELPTVHLIGHSLGAHMAANVGAHLKSGNISRLTGLDPAGPLFSFFPQSIKLDASDADFVDVIHTDAGGFGVAETVGHVDFFPNGGSAVQPGCHSDEIHERNPKGISEQIFCSHWRSYIFYAESVLNENAFPSVKCNSWEDFKRNECDNSETANMGFSASNNNLRGKFYLYTNSKGPYSIS